MTYILIILLLYNIIEERAIDFQIFNIINYYKCSTPQRETNYRQRLVGYTCLWTRLARISLIRDHTAQYGIWYIVMVLLDI